jgi:hypothetical protein
MHFREVQVDGNDLMNQNCNEEYRLLGCDAV